MAPIDLDDSFGVGAGPLDHGRVEVEPGHLDPVVAGQPVREMPGAAAHVW